MARAKKAAALTPEERLQAALVPDWEWPYKLPENWCWTTCKRITSRISDGSHNPPKDSGQGIPLLSATNIHDGIIDFENVSRWITEKEWVAENSRTNIEFGDVLLTIVATLGRTAVVDTSEKFALQRSVAVLKPRINSKYLAYCLDMPYIQSFISDNAKGTAQKGFYLNSVENIYIPLAPLAEQQRIVDRIESLFAKLDEAKEKAQTVLDSFETRKAAILHKAFTGELTARWRAAHSLNIASWNNLYLKDICDYMKAGGDKPVDFVDEQDDVHCIPVVANGISNEGIIGYSAESKYDGETVTVSGRGTIGYSIYRNYSYYPVVRLIVLGPKKDVYAKFLKYAFDAFPEEGTGSSIPQLTVPMIKEKVIPVPCIEEQAEIVRIIDSLFVKEQQAKEATEAVLEKIDLLKKSILARAFRGELGTNDPNDEPAVELLKKIL